MKKLIRFLRLKYIARIQFFRSAYYSLIFSSFGRGSIISGKITIFQPENINVGDSTSINIGCLLNARDKIIIGNNVHISPYVIINTGGLDYSKKMSKRDHVQSKVIIKDGVWVGSGAIINPGVIIGENTVIGAGAVVTRDIPANVIAVGIPARVLRDIE